MAKLPTAANLSGPDSFRSGRPIASWDTSAAGRGLASLGGDLSAIGAQIEKENNALDITLAESAKTKGFIDAKSEFENDPEYETFGKRVPARTSDVVNKAGNLIRDPKARELWLAGAQGDAARANDVMFGYGDARRKATELNAFDDALEVNRRIYVDPNTTEEEKQKARADIEASIGMAEETGFLDPNQADARRTTFIENADFSRGKLAVENDPDVISRPLPKDVGGRAEVAMGFFQSRGYTKEQAAGIVGNLIGESNLNPEIRGDGGMSHGIAQWNRDRLANLRRFAASRGKSWQDFGVQLEFIDWELQNVEKSAYNNLKNARTIDEATAAFIGYERPRGWTANNPKAGHNYNGRLKFAGQAAGVQVNPDWYARLSPEQRQVIDNQAETEWNKRDASLRGQIDVAAQNAPFAIQNTGQYDGYMPNAEDFFQAYGPEAGAQKYNAFQTAMDTSGQVFEMRTMSAGDIRQMVEDATPVSSGENAKLETDRYNTLASAAQTTLKQREADPASYVQKTFPGVEAAWQNVNEEGGYQQAISASVAAQQQLGITNVAPLPKPIAAGVVTAFNDKEQAEADRIAAVSGVLFATPDPEQRRAIFDQLVDAGLPAMTEGAFEAMARGDSGAARRLMQAAMIDVGSLPGKSPESQDAIDKAIQSELMDTGQIGDIYYGLSNGSAENYARAENDAKLISNAVHLRLRQGEGLTDAVNAAAKDLYGDVKVVKDGWNVNVQALVPTDVNAGQFRGGLEAMLPQVRDALTVIPGVPGEVSVADGSRAVIDAATANYAENVMAEGFFRNSGDGYVFIDPYVGAAVTGADGEPLMFTLDDVLKAGQAQPVTQPDRQDMPDAGRPEDRGIGFLPPQIMQDQQSSQPHNIIEDFDKLQAEALTLEPGNPRLTEINKEMSDISRKTLELTGKVPVYSPEYDALFEEHKKARDK